MPVFIVLAFVAVAVVLFVMGAPVLPKDQILGLANDAGFTGDDIATATAIALAESNGNPRAYNPEQAAGNPPGFGSYGLWQINLRAHPQYTAANLYDPAFNATAAYEVYRQQGFKAWSTYQSGKYQDFL